MQTATIKEVCPTKVWIESDFAGARHVMLQHDAPGAEPFCYATFNYHHHYTCNSMTFAAARDLAVKLGAAEPVEERQRPFAT